MNVLINYTGRTGGGAMYAYEMTRGLIENGVNVYAVISKECENLKEWEQLSVRRIIKIDTYTNKLEFLVRTILFIFWGRYKIKNELSDVEIDTIYSPMYTFWTYFINQLFPCAKKIVTIHDPILHSGESLIYRILNKLNEYDAKNADRIVILSHVFQKTVEREYNKSEDQVVIIPHGTFDYQTVHEKVFYDQHKINFLFFGRIEKYKGINCLLDIYKKIKNEFPDKVTLTIAGRGDFSPYVKQFHELKDARLINRWIKDEEVSDFFEGNKVVTVLPYIDATQSGIVGIAMAKRSLIIASNVGGLSEQLKDGNLGILFSYGTQNDLYQSMKSVVEHYDSYASIIDRAYCYAQQSNWAKDAARLIED